jgi:hypothetical protein
MSKQIKPQVIVLSSNGRLLVGPTVFKEKDYIQIARQYLDTETSEWRFKTAINIPPDKWEALKVAVNKVTPN